MPVDAAVLRHKTPNPFRSDRALNPLSMLDEPLLVAVPSAPETHERRQVRRGYLNPNGGGMDNLFSLLDGKTPQVPRKIEVVRNVPSAPEADHDAEDAGGSPPPRYGRK